MDFSEVKVGDKVVFKKWEELDGLVRAINDEVNYKQNFSGKACTVCNVITRPGLAVEVEEDEDLTVTNVGNDDGKFLDLLLDELLGKHTKRHYFSEKFIEEVIPQGQAATQDKKTGDSHDFGWALNGLKAGKKMRRKGWNGKGIFIELQRPDKYSKMTHPYIYIDTTGLKTDNPDAPKDRVPWLASQTDMLAEDWEVFND